MIQAFKRFGSGLNEISRIALNLIWRIDKACSNEELRDMILKWVVRLQNERNNLSALSSTFSGNRRRSLNERLLIAGTRTAH